MMERKAAESPESNMNSDSFNGENMRYKCKLKTISFYFLALMAFETVSLPLAFAHGGMTGNGHFLPWLTGSWGMGWFGLVFTLLFWILVILGIIALVRWIVQAASGKDRLDAINGESSRAMEILKERYAKGEISRDEFESMKKDLQ